MADNPIKHDDLIQPGNAFDATIKGLKEMITLIDKLRKGLKETAKTQQDYAQKQDTSTKSGQAGLKKVATATAKLSEQDKELLRVQKQLDKEVAKAALLQNKEYQAIVKKTEATKKANREMDKTIKQQATGAKSTNTWSKSLGSFAFKFNALGNMAAMAMQKIIRGITNSIKKFTSMEKIMRSTQLSSDAFDRAMGRLEGSFHAFNRAIALGDFENLGKTMRDAADAAEVYVRAMDALGDTQNAIDIQTAKSRLEVGRLQEIYNNTARDNKERLDAAIAAEKILASLQEHQEKVSRARFENEYQRIQSDFQLTDEQLGVYRRFIENYNLLTDEQITKLEGLEAQQMNTSQGSVDLTKVVRSATSANTDLGQSTNLVNTETAKFNSMAAELSETLGFDVLPIMKAVVGTNDEARKKVVEATIAYYDQLRATQKLTNANAAMQGSILNKMKTDKESNDEMERTPELIFNVEQALRNLGKSFKVAAQDDIIKVLRVDIPNAAVDMVEDIKESSEESKQEQIKNAEMVFQASANFANALSNIVATQKAKELSAVGDNAKKREEIEKKYAKKEQAMAISKAIIGTALAVINALQTQPFLPMGPIMAIIAGVAGGIEIAAIAGESFAEGGSGLLDDKGGVLQGKRHSQGGVNLGAIGEAERGEYFGIVNRQMTKKYAGDLPNIFDSLNNGAFHEIWGRSNVTTGDPYTKKMYELMQNTPVIIPEGKRIEKYPTGRTRIVNV